MTFPVLFEVTAVGLAASLAAIVAGAPVFSSGWRALRLRRAVRSLVPAELTESADGLVIARGHVLPDAARVAPLSGQLCAGWELVVQAPRTRLAARAAEHDDFRIDSGFALAEVDAARAQWQMPVTAERSLAAGEALPAAFAKCFEKNADFAWLRGLGVPLRCTERALAVGAQVHVVAVAAHAEAEVQVLRTGTSDDAVEVTGPRVHLGRGEWLDHVLVSSEAPSAAVLAPPSWRAAGAVLGPALTLGGIAYLLFAMLTSLTGVFG